MGEPLEARMTQVLLVDDDELSRSTIHQMLERAGYQVRSGRSGSEALAFFRAERADLVVTDLIMPDTDGLELIQELRKIDPAVRILAISGGGRVNAEEYLSVARKFGAAGILAKPFSNQDLRTAVQAALANPPEPPVLPKQ